MRMAICLNVSIPSHQYTSFTASSIMLVIAAQYPQAQIFILSYLEGRFAQIERQVTFANILCAVDPWCSLKDTRSNSRVVDLPV